MLELVIPSKEIFDEINNKVITIKGATIKLEHSLVSLSKWESKWNKPFLTDEEKSIEETIDYIKFMTITQNVDPEIYEHLDNNIISKVNEYISAPMTATTFNNTVPGAATHTREIITAEIIYYWMISCNIPVEFQKWHLNRLLTLIKVCSIKNGPTKKMSANEIRSRNAALNAQRRKAMNTKG